MNVDALIAELESQRNQAMNQLARACGEYATVQKALAEAQAKIKELTNHPVVKEDPAPQPEAPVVALVK